MTDYTAAQKSISATFDSDIEVVTPELEKIQFTSSGKLQLTRPDKLRIRRTGGYFCQALEFIGKKGSVCCTKTTYEPPTQRPSPTPLHLDMLPRKNTVTLPIAGSLLV